MNKSGLRPLGAAVLVKPYKPEQKQGMIVIPDSVQARDNMIEERAEIIAIGPKCWSSEGGNRANVGDKVLISAFSGYQAKGSDGELYRFVNDRDIFALIEVQDNE